MINLLQDIFQRNILRSQPLTEHLVAYNIWIYFSNFNGIIKKLKLNSFFLLPTSICALPSHISFLYCFFLILCALCPTVRLISLRITTSCIRCAATFWEHQPGIITHSYFICSFPLPLACSKPLLWLGSWSCKKFSCFSLRSSLPLFILSYSWFLGILFITGGDCYVLELCWGNKEETTA